MIRAKPLSESSDERNPNRQREILASDSRGCLVAVNFKDSSENEVDLDVVMCMIAGSSSLLPVSSKSAPDTPNAPLTRSRKAV